MVPIVHTRLARLSFRELSAETEPWAGRQKDAEKDDKAAQRCGEEGALTQGRRTEGTGLR